jgi:PAS domain S-box-containing protein
VANTIATVPPNTLFVLAFWRAARRPGLDPRFATAFRLLVAGETMVILANLCSIYLVLATGQDPTWGWTNALFLSYYPFTIAGIARLPRDSVYQPRRESVTAPLGGEPRSLGGGSRRLPYEAWKFVLDTLIIVIGSAVAIWYLVLRNGAAREVAHHPFLAVAFPIGDLVLLLSLTTTALHPPGGRYRPAIVLLLLGGVISVAGDFLYTLVFNVGPSQAQAWGDTMYMVSYVLLVASAERYRATNDGVFGSGERTDRRPLVYESPVPYAIAMAVYGLVLVVAMQTDSPLGLLVAGAAPVTMLLTLRGALTGRQTGQLLAERATRAGEARCRSLVQNASDAILIVDRGGLIRFASPAAHRVLGVEPDALTGIALSSLAIKADELVVATLLDGVRDQPGGSASATWEVRHADGLVHHLETVVTNLTTEPAVGGLVVNIRDVTDRHNLQSRLEHAQRLEAIGQLAGGVAHDFNNILTAISGNAELAIADLNNPSAAAESLSEIRTAAARASALTRQLLAFSRKQVLRAERVDVNAVIHGCGKMLARLIGEDIRLKLTLAPDLPAILADPVQLEQVLVNLVVNARDAMPAGGSVRIETDTVVVSAEDAREWPGLVPDRYVKIAVQDNGTGMDEATRVRVFEPFFTTKPAGQGTGLGLSTVYGIVKQSGGYVYVTSAPSVGSTFTMYFPLAMVLPSESRAPAVAPVQPKELPSAAAAASAPALGATVLVVEDEPAVRGAMAQALVRQGFNVLQAVDGADGLAVAARHAGTIDVVVSDVVMPHLTGPAMLERMRRVRPGLRALFVSGYAAPQLRGRVAATAVTVLEKPFSLADLTTRVRDLVASGD